MKLYDMDVAGLARRMKANQEHASAVLLIGLDGGAALLNHARPARFLDALRADRPPGKRDQARIGEFWSVLSSETKDDVLKRNTRPSDDEGPDSAAIGHLAELLRKGYLNAIVTTDPAQCLYQGIIDAGLTRLRRIEAVGHKPRVFELRRRGIEGTDPVLVDGAEMLITGLEPTRLDEQGPQLGEMRGALRAFLESFGDVYCWGWCSLNVPLSVLYGKTAPVFLLGNYTDPVHLESSHNLVRGGESDEDDATTDLLIHLAKEIGLPPPPAQPSVVPALAVTHGRAVARRDSPPPLLTADQLRELKASALDRPVTLIGIDGERTRRRTAEWLLADLDGGLSPADLRGGGDLVAMGRWLGLRAQGTRHVVVGELYDVPTPNPGLWPRLAAVITWWQQSVQGQGAHIVLFCPVVVAEWAQGFYGISDSVRGQPLGEELFRTEDAVVEWIMRELGPLVAWLDQNEVIRLVEVMGAVVAQPEVDADWVHDALDIWRQEVGLAVLRSTPPAGADGTVLPGPSLDDLGRLWSEVVHRLVEATEAVQPAFTLAPSPRHDAASAPDPDGGSPDFDIVPTPHRPDGDPR